MRLLKSTAIIGAFTLMSRVLGLIRDIMLARYLGAGVINDALVTAIKLPNLFRRMFAEGAFNAAFVPLYARRIEEEGDVSAAQFSTETLSFLSFIVILIVIGFQLTMPWSLNLIGFGLDRAALPGSNLSPYDLAVLYARLTMPYLLLMSLAALFSGILNTRGYFAAAAFAPVLLNLVLIFILALVPVMDWGLSDIAMFLAIGYPVSGVLQAVILYLGLRKAGIRIGIKRPRLTPGVRRLIVLGIPGLISAGITHINLMVSHSIATLKAGAASWLYYADRLYQLPLGMIGIAMGVALLPALSRRLRAGDEAGAMTSLNRAFEIAAILTLPASIALGVMPEFLISGLFERGEFLSSDTRQAALALQMFAMGLPAFVLIKVLTPAFFAREDTRTPMLFAGLSAVTNLGLGAALFFTVGFYGLALATSVAAWINVVCLALSLSRSKHLVLDARLKARLPRIFLAALIMGGGLWAVRGRLDGLLSGPIAMDFIAMVSVSGAGLALYMITIFILRAYGVADIRDALRRT